ncbi:MAG: hypothetical protein P4L83_00300 [Nevskia sp.]|nr:hypothetical protein [Nevskia sp.]
MPSPAATAPACQARTLLAAAHARAANDEAAAGIHQQALHALRTYEDDFLDAVGRDFLAESDERHLRSRYQGERLNQRLARNQRTRAAQSALHRLYRTLLANAAMSAEEKALAEHARDLCQAWAERDSERSCHSRAD